jgi:hypothetical protein
MEYGYTFIPQQSKKTYFGNVDDGNFLKIHLTDVRGEMDVEYCAKDSGVLEKGHYINSLSLLRTYSEFVNGTTGRQQIRVVEYYQPLRDGIWYFYDRNKKLIDKKTYNRGVLSVSSSNK